MCKQIYDDEAVKITDYLIKIKKSSKSFDDLIKNKIKNKDNFYKIINDISKLLVEKGFYIESINPFTIKEI